MCTYMSNYFLKGDLKSFKLRVKIALALIRVQQLQEIDRLKTDYIFLCTIIPPEAVLKIDHEESRI